MTVADIIAKRKLRWEERGDIEYDKLIVESGVKLIFEREELLSEVIEKPYLLIEAAFLVVDKKRRTVPFFLNEVQKDFIHQLEERGTKKPYFILKGRQQGFTTVITAIQLSFAIVRKNFAGFTMADRADNTAAIFNDKARVVYDRLPERLKPSEKFNSKNEIFFDKLNSSWRVATATADVGRSRTLNFVHFSEVAFYECSLSDLQAGIGQAITADAIQVYESTARGFNQAKELWDSGSCHNLFYEWWRSEEYRSTEYDYLDTFDAWLAERKKLLFELGCDREQVTWYCKKYASYLDKSLIKQEYPCTPEEAFLASGKSMFDMDALTNQMARLGEVKHSRVGYFEYDRKTVVVPSEDGDDEVEYSLENIRWREDAGGYITIHDEPEVKRDKAGEIIGLAPYAIGGDTAGSGEDCYTAKVVQNMTGKTAATLRVQRIDEDVYAEQLYCLGMLYHEAMIGVEINYSRQPTRVLAEKYNYPSMYMREKLDGITKKIMLDFGFETTKKSKPIIINELVSWFRDNSTLEVDRETLREMSTFVKKDGGIMEAIDGFHDDLVMALAIAHFVGKQQQSEWIEPKDDTEDFIRKNFGEQFTSGDSGDGNEEYMSWDEL